MGLLYLLAFWLLYRLARRRLERRPLHEAARSWIVVALLLVVLFVSGTLPLLIFLFAGGEYVGFVFSSAVSLAAGAALAFAVALAGLALTSTAERARAVGDATLLASFFWVGAAYLALWVVYVLVLTSLWPLKVVTSK